MPSWLRAWVKAPSDLGTCPLEIKVYLSQGWHNAVAVEYRPLLDQLVNLRTTTLIIILVKRFLTTPLAQILQ